jgi:hypothetical protein
VSGWVGGGGGGERERESERASERATERAPVPLTLEQERRVEEWLKERLLIAAELAPLRTCQDVIQREISIGIREKTQGTNIPNISLYLSVCVSICLSMYMYIHV